MNGLQLNYLELKFNKDRINLPLIKYQSDEWFAQIKKENPDKIFKRDGENVYYWNRDFSDIGSLLNGSEFSTINFNEHSSILCRILESFYNL